MAHLRDLQPNPLNARTHTERGIGQIAESLQRHGFGRSLLGARMADGSIRLIAGHATTEALAQIGMEDVEVVETDGRKPIVLVRTDLDPDSPEAHELGLADNRTPEHSGWDPQVLAALRDEGVQTDWLWFKDEFPTPDVVPDFAPVGIDEQGRLDEKKQVECPECGHWFAP